VKFSGLRRNASQIDPVHETLPLDIWDFDGRNYKLKEYLVNRVWQLLNFLFSFHKGGINSVVRVCIVGSTTTQQYNSRSDVDINIEVDRDVFISFNPEATVYEKGEYAYMMDKIWMYLEGIPVGGGINRTFSIHIYFYPFILSSDGIYVLFERFRDGRLYRVDRWMKGPFRIPQTFQPDLAFESIKREAELLREELVRFASKCKRKDLRASVIKAIERFFVKFRQHRFAKAVKGKGDYRAYRFSPDWDAGNIFMKYLGSFSKPYRKLFIKED